MLTIEELRKLHDKAYLSNQDTREEASDDLVFYWVTQWDDQLLSQSQLEYRGEFNVLRKAGRQVMADLRSNPVQVDFEPVDEARDDAAEFLDGLYRADDRKNASIEAYDFGAQDAVVCGFGAWELYTEYKTTRSGNDEQIIKRRWIPEANNTAFPDPNAKLLDKSDGMYWSVLASYSVDGFKELYKDLTGEEFEGTPSDFAMPEQSLAFPWFSSDEKVNVVNFYHKEKVKDKVLTVADPFGMESAYLESEVEDHLESLTVVSEKEIERWKITKYIAYGDGIIDSFDVPGEHIPVVPVYGERAIVEGQEVYQGVTRLAKDPQRLRNFQLSYLADIVSRSPRRKPIFHPEQIQGFEHMYEPNGSDNNFPYLLQRRQTANGEPLPIGAVAEMPDQPIPQALAASIELTENAVSDVADAGLPQNIADPDMSGKAIHALQSRIDKQSYIYQHNMKHAKRYDGLVYASMASSVYDAPRSVRVTAPDGSSKQVQVMQGVIDESGEIQVLNDLTNMEFEVYADIGPSYDSQKEQTKEQLQIMLGSMQPDDPMREFVMLKILELSDGVNTKDLREYVRKQMILKGYKEPDTEEDMLLVQQAQEAMQNQPNPAMLEGQARVMEGQAALQNEANDAAKVQVDAYNAETKRREVEIKAAEVGVKIENTQADTQGKMIDNAQKVISPLMQRVGGGQAV